ncbi:YlaH-like family protein [Virgibacillus kimchii]
MDTNFSLIFDFLLDNYGTSINLFWVFYVLNFIFGIIAYKLGFAKKLSFIKSLVVYILFAIGVYVITIFSIFNLPITESLIIISIVLAIYRIRLHNQRTKKES